MPESREILINQRFSETQSQVNSKLVLTDDYYSYQQTSLGGGITSEFNVRQYLSDPNNENIGNDFFNFLTANTTIEEFRVIFNSNEKLSAIFNNYYERSVVAGQASSRDFVEVELTGTTPITVYTPNVFDWNEAVFSDPFGNKMQGEVDSIVSGPRKSFGPEGKVFLERFTNENSYYLPIFLNRSHSQKAVINFSSFSEDCLKEVTLDDGTKEEKFLKQCFVDINAKNDPRELYNSPTVNTIGFITSSVLSVDEGDTVDISISLVEPSNLGLEEVSIRIDPDATTATEDDYNLVVDGIPVSDQIISFKFAPGELTKTLSVRINEDFVFNDNNSLTLVLSNLFNVALGERESVRIDIVDKTILLDMSVGLESVATVQNITYGEKFIASQPETSRLNPEVVYQTSSTNQGSYLNGGVVTNLDALFWRDVDLEDLDSFGYGPYSSFNSSENVWVAPRSATISLRASARLYMPSDYIASEHGSIRIIKENAFGTSVVGTYTVTVTTGSNRNMQTNTGAPAFERVNIRNTTGPHELVINNFTVSNIQVNQGDKLKLQVGSIVVLFNNKQSFNENMTLTSASMELTDIEGGEVITNSEYVEFNKGEALNIPINLSQASEAGIEVGTFSLTKINGVSNSLDSNQFNISPRTVSFAAGEDSKIVSVTAKNTATTPGIIRFNFVNAERANILGKQAFDLIVV